MSFPAQDIQMEQSKGRIINEWDVLDESLHRQEAAMPFSQFASRSAAVSHCTKGRAPPAAKAEACLSPQAI